MLRKGIVVESRPGSVDLVMIDTGERLVGVQVSTPSGSSRSGTIDMPAVPPKRDKWDITGNTGQEMEALVAMVRGQPVVVGFLYPQINQVLPGDGKTLYGRHQSDVEWMIDGDGNIQLSHPGGFYLRMGEAPDKAASPVAPASIDRNTGRRVHVRIGLASNAVVLTMTPDGAVTLELEQDCTIKAGGRVVLDAPETHCTGSLVVDGLLTYKAGMAGSGGSTTAVITGNMQVEGNIDLTGNVTAGGVITDSNGDGGA